VVVVRKLIKNGNSIQVSIPRAYLTALGWYGGEAIALELSEDGTIWVRRPTQRDLRSTVRIPLASSPTLVGAK